MRQQKKKHNKFRHNAHLFSHRVQSECWVNCSSLMVFEIDVALMLTIINCCLLIGMLANVYPHPLPFLDPIQGLRVIGNFFWGTLSL